MSNIFKIVLCLLIISSISFLASIQLSETEYSPASDEGYYYRYAYQVAQEGWEGFQKIIRWYVDHEEARYHPAPTRIGYILFAAVLFKAFGPSYELLGLVSFISFLGFLWVCFYFIKKYFNDAVALCATVLLSSSPLLLAMSRRALIDSMVNLTWALSFWMFLEVISKPNAKRYFLFLLCFTWALFVKESAIVLLFFFLIFLFLSRKKPLLANRFYFWGMVLIPFMTFMACLVIAAGGLESAISATWAILDTHLDPQHTNFYAIKFSSGPWFRYILDFLLLLPIVILLFLGYFLSLIGVKSKSLVEKYFLTYFIVIFSFFSFLPHTKVVRFVINLETVIVVFAILYIDSVFRRSTVRHAEKLFFLIIILLFIVNWTDFYFIFVRTGLLDPISFHLLQIRGFIP